MTQNTPVTPHYYNFQSLTRLERATLDALSSHVGRDKALPLKTLIDHLRLIPALDGATEVQVRLAISRLRKLGKALICSSGRDESCYWLASNLGEVLDYLEHDVQPLAEELVEIQFAMLDAAIRAFERPHQPPPF